MSWKDSTSRFWPGRLSDEEAAQLAARVAELARAGLPLESGLRAWAAELQQWRLSSAVRELADRLAEGRSLDEAIQHDGLRLPAHVRALVVAAVRSGRLPEVLEEFVDLQQAQSQLRRRVWVSLSYPLVLLVLVCGVILLCQGYIAVQFGTVFRDFGAALPDITKVFLALSFPITFIVLAVVVLSVVVLVLPISIPGLGFLTWIKYQVPITGSLWRWSRMGQFCRLMSVLLEQSVPLPEALRLTAVGVSDAYLAAGCRRVAADVEQGAIFYESLAARSQFPATLVPLVQWGQQAPALPDAFRAAGEMYEGRARTHSVFLETILLPIMLIVIGGFVSLFIVAMFFPMISLIQKLSA